MNEKKDRLLLVLAICMAITAASMVGQLACVVIKLMR